MDSNRYFEDWQKLIFAASKLQEIIPNAILVGGSAASVHLQHRFSFDADHTLQDLDANYENILNFLEDNENWQTARVTPPKIILGNFHGVETGIRQLRREKPLETEKKQIGDRTVTVPTLPEMIRIKAWMIVSRNALRDYVDFAVLCYYHGLDSINKVLCNFDDYYLDLQRNKEVSPLLQLIKQLSEPKPHDLQKHIGKADSLSYKGIQPPFDSWSKIEQICKDVSINLMLSLDGSENISP